MITPVLYSTTIQQIRTLAYNMKLSTFIALAAASASTTLAVPVQADANGVANMMVKSCTWTIQNFGELWTHLPMEIFIYPRLPRPVC